MTSDELVRLFFGDEAVGRAAHSHAIGPHQGSLIDRYRGRVRIEAIEFRPDARGVMTTTVGLRGRRDHIEAFLAELRLLAGTQPNGEEEWNDGRQA